MVVPYPLARSILFRFDAEKAHDLGIGLAAFAARHPWLCSLTRGLYAPPPTTRLAVDAFGLKFANPIGLAAGLDKNGVAIDLWASLGFGFVEVGTVTPGAGQAGNEKPRMERLVKDRAVVNRMGFNNLGADHLATRLAERRTKIPVGANIGKAKVTPLEAAPDDYEATLRSVWKEASYVVVNVSSPNTPGLRNLQAVDALEPLLARAALVNGELARVHEEKPRPLLVKIAPDLADEDVDCVADLAVAVGLDGIIATNTTLRHDLASQKPTIAGGLSGRPLGPRALALTKRLYRRAPTLPIIGVGGISSGEDVYRRIRAGATLVQVYTGFIYEGPGWPGRLARQLDGLLGADGFSTVSEAVGIDAN